MRIYILFLIIWIVAFFLGMMITKHKPVNQPTKDAWTIDMGTKQK